MKRKHLLAILMLLVFSLVLYGCQAADETTEPDVTELEDAGAPVTEAEQTAEPDAEEETEEDAAEPTGDKQVVKFAVQADSTDALNQLVAAFNEQSENYTVETTIMTNDSGQMHDQLLNSLSSQSGEYDVISMDVVWVGEFAAAGYLETVDEILMDNQWLPTDFNQGSMDSGKYSGKSYALPYFPDLGFLFFRKDIVSEEDQATLVSGDYTWADLLAMAENYAEGDTPYGYVFQAMQYEGLTVNLNEFSANWGDLSGGLEQMKAFVDSASAPEDILSYTEGETANAFVNGEAVFARNWPYMNGMIASDEHNVKIDQVGYAPLPEGGSVGGWLVGVNASSQNKEGAIEFITFLAGPEGQKINATVGSYLPGYNGLLEDAEVLAANTLLEDEGFQNALQATIARPVVANYSEVSDTIQINAHQYLSGNGELDEAVSQIEGVLP
ncbi:MAG: extracellular solute-binding protein [Tissierellia bacterium]|jgi:multiple sugar transport system substrate-binding protein|nr:extracellular solute-binding protein [Bacillota bacterium]NLK58125.1 extracellular solute-binding protein [Tissierellia bacterium]